MRLKVLFLIFAFYLCTQVFTTTICGNNCYNILLTNYILILKKVKTIMFFEQKRNKGCLQKCKFTCNKTTTKNVSARIQMKKE